MPRKRESPVEEFPGYVIVSDPLYAPAVIAMDDAIEEATQLRENGHKTHWSRLQATWLPGIIKCIDEWHIEGLPDTPTPDTIPMTPREPAIQLTNWLLEEVMQVYSGEGGPDPND